MVKRGVEKIRHRSRKGMDVFLDGKQLVLPDLIQTLMVTAEKLRVQGSDHDDIYISYRMYRVNNVNLLQLPLKKNNLFSKFSKVQK